MNAANVQFAACTDIAECVTCDLELQDQWTG